MPDSLSTQQYAFVYVAPPSPRSYNAPTGFVEHTGVSTLIIDSIAADTVGGRVPHFVPVARADSLRAEEIAAHFPPIPINAIPSGTAEGVEPSPREPLALCSTPMSFLLTAVFILAAVNASSLRRALVTYGTELWKVRSRGNMFDGDVGVRIPTAVLLGIVFVVSGGLALYGMCGSTHPSFAGACAMMALTAAYYVFQLCAYGAVGNTFATADESRQWIDGFCATQAYLGIALALPAVLTVCCPEWDKILSIVSLSIYEALHLVFILKGFKIFYRTIGSLLYFILYLCTLEILPQIAIYRLALYISDVI